jgi:cysteine-rich repeat protein
MQGSCVQLPCSDPRRPSECGDGCKDVDEDCDDGNVDDGDGCSQACLREVGFECGDGGTNCSADCGDELVRGDEQCDDGNNNDFDGCDRFCTLTRFGVSLAVSGQVDGVDSKATPLQLPLGLSASADGMIYVADSANNRILRFDPSAGDEGDSLGDTVVVAGNGRGGFSGDGGPALQAQLCVPTDVEVDNFGNLFIADAMNHRIRRVDRRGIITTIAGYTPEGIDCNEDIGRFITSREETDDREFLGSLAAFHMPVSLAYSAADSLLYVVDSFNLRIRRLTPPAEPGRSSAEWTVRTIAGARPSKSGCFEPDPGAEGSRDPRRICFGGSTAFLSGSDLGPLDIAISPDGTLVVADTSASRLVEFSDACLKEGLQEDCVINKVPVGGIPIGIHYFADGRRAVADFFFKSIRVDGSNVLNSTTAISIRGAEGGTPPPEPMDAPRGLTSIGDVLYAVDPLNNRLLRRRTSGAGAGGGEQVMGQVRGDRDGQEARDEGVSRSATETDLRGPTQIGIQAGSLLVVDALNLTVLSIATDAERPSDNEVETVLTNRRPDVVSAITGNQQALDSIVEGECVDADDLGDLNFSPLGLAVLPREAGFIVTDRARGRVLGVSRQGHVCNLLSSETTAGPRFSPKSAAVLDTAAGPVVTVVDDNNTKADGDKDHVGRECRDDEQCGGYWQCLGNRCEQCHIDDDCNDNERCTRGLCQHVHRLWRIRLARDADGLFGLQEGGVGPQVEAPVDILEERDLPIGTYVSAITDVLPLDEQSTLLADAKGHIVWLYSYLTGTTTTFIGGDGIHGEALPQGTSAPLEVKLRAPAGLALCPDGRLLVADNGKTEEGDPSEVNPTGLQGSFLWQLNRERTQISVLAGDGERRHQGDFGPARQASMDFDGSHKTIVGIACDETGTVYVSEARGGRIRRIDREGIITTFAGRSDPAGPGPDARRARLYGPMTFATGLPAQPLPALVVVDGGFGDGTGSAGGRVVVVGPGNSAQNLLAVDIAAGYENPFVAPDRAVPALAAPLLAGARGAAWDAARQRLIVTQSASSSLRVFDVAVPGAWVDVSFAVPEAEAEVVSEGLSGIALDPLDESFIVVDEDDHCLRRLSRELQWQEDPVFGVVGEAGDDDTHLHTPSHLAFSPGGVLFVADAGNHRVVRIDGEGAEARASVVIGNGQPVSAGEGAPARAMSVNTPRQIAFDSAGNLYVTSRTTVRVVFDSDDDQSPDGDDRVVTVYGNDRSAYPEKDSRCIEAIAPVPEEWWQTRSVEGSSGALARASDESVALFAIGDSCLGAAALLAVEK